MTSYAIRLARASEFCIATMILVAPGCGDDADHTTEARAISTLTGPNVWAEASLPVFNSDQWGVSATGSVVTKTSERHAVSFPLTMPHGETLLAVSVTYGAAGGHSAMPDLMPLLSVVRTNVSTGDAEWVATIADPTDNVDAYQATHEIVLDSLDILIDRTTYRYQITFESEHGTNAIPGAGVAGVRYQLTAPAQ